jgi:hypothetical protein
MTSDQVVDVLGTFVAQLDSNVPSSVARTATSGFPQVSSPPLPPPPPQMGFRSIDHN